MKLSIISDVHITTKQDESFHLFLDFLEAQKKARPDTVILLGDIFDAIAGDQKKYLIKYHDIFVKIKELTDQGIKFIYFEGNHDMHLVKLFNRVCEKYQIDKSCFEVERKYRLIEDETRRLYIAHGDELDGDETYLKYKSFIHGKFMQTMADHVIPFYLLEYVANRASKKSRGINYVKYSSVEEQKKIELSFRNIARTVSQQYKAQFVFLGHSHLRDLFQEDFTYANCGYFTSEKCYIEYNQGVVEFKKLQ